MEETRSSGELIDSMDDLLVQLALRRTMRKRTAALAALDHPIIGQALQRGPDGLTAGIIDTAKLLLCRQQTPGRVNTVQDLLFEGSGDFFVFESQDITSEFVRFLLMKV